MVTLFILMLIHFSCAIIGIVNVFESNETVLINISEYYSSEIIDITPFEVIGWIFAILDIPLGFGVLQLLAFHIFLRCKGMTTYSYVTKQREDPVLDE